MSNLLLRRSAQMGRHSLLPKEYQQVEYIESTGTQWIDTGVYGTQDTVLRADAMSYGYLLNTGAMGVYINGGIALSMFVSPYSCNIRRGTNSKNHASGVFTANNRYTIENNPIGFYKNGQQVLTWTNDNSFRTPVTIYLFSTNQLTHQPFQSLYGRIYSASIIESGILCHHYIPCYRKNDNTAGMYDTVSHIFYQNQGADHFLLGPIL